MRNAKKTLFNITFVFLGLGIFFGAFYREFTKFIKYTGETRLSVLHTHTLTLGFIFFFLVLLANERFDLASLKSFKAWLILHVVATVGVIGALFARGLGQIYNNPMKGLSHMTGLIHVLITITFVWFMLLLRKRVIE